MTAGYSPQVHARLAELGLPARAARAGRLPCPRCAKPRAYVTDKGWLNCNRRNKCGYAAPLGGLAVGALRSSPSARVATRARPPLAEVERFWTSARPLVDERDDATDTAARAFLASKGIDPRELSLLGLARLAPSWSACAVAWWPRSWSKHRLIVRAFELDGRLASVHARAVEPLRADEPKTRWPLGCDARGLVFASPETVNLLAGHAELTREVSSLLVVEGLTDFLVASLMTHARERTDRWRAVVGVTSGSVGAFGGLRLPRGLPVLVGTDDDPAGETYAGQIARALPDHPCRRVRLGEIGGRR